MAAPAADSGGSNANAFNPAISIILNGSYSHHSLDPDDYVRAGFPLAGEAGPGADGFSLGESEVSFASNIDDKFYGQLTLTAESEDGEDHVGVEEAFIDTTSLPANFSLRAGRFFSNIGYLNSHHAHTDNFFDRPLPYQAFLGNQYGDDGVQLRWVAPTSLFLEFGGELFRGENFPSGGAQHGGVGTRTLFAHVGGDVGTESSWLAGVSMLKTQVGQRRGRLQRRHHAVHRRRHLEVGAERQHQGRRHHAARRVLPRRSRRRVRRPDGSAADGAVERPAPRCLSRRRLSPQPHLGRRLPLRPALGRMTKVRRGQRLRSVPPQRGS